MKREIQTKEEVMSYEKNPKAIEGIIDKVLK